MAMTVDEQVAALVASGWDHGKVNDLCRGPSGFHTVKEMGSILSQDVPGTTLRHVRALMQHLGVPSLSSSEQRLVNRGRPTNDALTAARVERMAAVGWDAARIQSEYDAGLTKNDLIARINADAGKVVVSKTSLRTAWAHMGLVERSAEANNAVRMAKVNDAQRANYATKANYGHGISADEAVALYQGGKSLEQMYRDHGISPSVLSRILKERGEDVRSQIPVEDTISMLSKAGVGEEELRQWYHGRNLTAMAILERIEQQTGVSISVRTWEKMVVQLGLHKDEQLVSQNRGVRGRDELEENLAKLERAGFSTLQELADHFHSHHSLTYYDLVQQLNQGIKAEDEPFTVRWLARNMTPLLPEGRDKGTSRLEKSVGEFIRGVYQGEVQERVRSLIAPLEVDFYFPELRMAVEVNGLYWHSEKFGKDRNYHRRKYLACRAQGVQLVQVWEDDWYHRREVVESMLRHRLGGSGPGIGARKTRVVSVDVSAAREFMDAFHIQGFVGATWHWGLEGPGGLVAVLSVVGKTGGDIEIVRYATAQSVPGGFTKLLSQVEKEVHPMSIKTFSDCEVSDGALYARSGFLVDGELPPDYSYVFSGRREHKFNFRKSRFQSNPNLLFEEGLTETQLAALNGINRVWDSGKVRWIKSLPS